MKENKQLNDLYKNMAALLSGIGISVDGCHKISAGCENCYVYRTDTKYEKDSSVVKKTGNFNLPLKRNRQGEYKLQPDEIVYTCFTSDFLLSDADEWRNDAWNMMRIRNDLKFLFITKRIDRLQK